MFIPLGVTFTFVVMIFGIIPWSQIIGGADADPYAWELGWGFGELSASFIVAAIVVGLIGGLGEKPSSSCSARTGSWSAVTGRSPRAPAATGRSPDR